MLEQGVGYTDYSKEMHTVYADENVIAMLSDCKWFNVDYILDAVANEPLPEYSLEHGLEDKRLAQFLQTNIKDDDFGLYRKLDSYVTERMVASHGHPYRVGSVPFADESFLELVKLLGGHEEYEIERGMINEVDYYLKCLIAPVEMRRKVVKQLCRWGEGREDRKRDILIWASLTRKGAEQFFEELQQRK